jgi:hypothetical protein
LCLISLTGLYKVPGKSSGNCYLAFAIVSVPMNEGKP